MQSQLSGTDDLLVNCSHSSPKRHLHSHRYKIVSLKSVDINVVFIIVGYAKCNKIGRQFIYQVADMVHLKPLSQNKQIIKDWSSVALSQS